MKWNKHTETILKSASKVIRIMRKLKYNFSRTALNQVYISFVRPLLEYSCIVWDGCTTEQSNTLEKLQNEAARIVTGLTLRSVSLERLYKECGWESLHSRRLNQKLKFMYRAVNEMIPSYISQLIPPTVGNSSHYNLRDSNNITMLVSLTTTFKRSCIPSAINLWNNLDLNIRQKPTLSLFSYALRSQIIQNIVPHHYTKGNRKHSILHARIRNCCSNLHLDLYINLDPIAEICFQKAIVQHITFNTVALYLKKI